MDMFVPKKGQGPILTPSGGLSDSDEERESGSKVKRDGSPATPARSSASASGFVNIPSAASAAAVSGASGVSAGSLGGADAAAARAMEDMQYVFSRLDEVQDGLADHLQRAGGPPGTSVQEGTSGAQTPRGPTTGNSEGEDGMFSTAMSVGEEPEKVVCACAETIQGTGGCWCGLGRRGIQCGRSSGAVQHGYVGDRQGWRRTPKPKSKHQNGYGAQR